MYLASGHAVLAANFPEARRMVEGYDVGLCFDPYDPRSIAAQLTRLATEPELQCPAARQHPAMRCAASAQRTNGASWSRLYRDLADDATGLTPRPPDVSEFFPGPGHTRSARMAAMLRASQGTAAARLAHRQHREQRL
jgi:hypothetical protein